MTVTTLDRSSHFSFENFRRAHGVGLRGLDVPRGSEQFEGRFGRMFRTLPPAGHSETALVKLAKKMVAEDEGTPPNDDPDAEENSGITAGYTYFGQFLDHDITFDPASSLMKTNDPDALTDFRTPRFDLDCVYGRGPDDQPYLYRDDGLHMLLGRALTGDAAGLTNKRDLPRNNPEGGDPQRALIGDPRNDENTIVSQLQSTFLQFHNKVADLEAARLGAAPKFADVQRLVRWHYQYAILHDFLQTICGQDTVFDVLPHLKSGESIHVHKPDLRFFKWRNAPFMPIEFSVAAYRFGHSMVRPFYRLSSTIQLPIFTAGAGESFRGFRAFPANWGINWNLFFGKGGPTSGPTRIQPAYKIDTSLVNPLGTLPDNVAKDIKSLAERNLLRGLRMRLPSGQTVARKMRLPVIKDNDLRIGKATEEDAKDNPRLIDVDPSFADNAPLWTYVLAEAQQQFKKDGTPIHLGAVGGRIVAEVFAGLLLGDNHSFLAQDPEWTPFGAFGGKNFRIIDLLKAALT
jgi:hypothetical protein